MPVYFVDISLPMGKNGPAMLNKMKLGYFNLSYNIIGVSCGPFQIF